MSRKPYTPTTQEVLSRYTEFPYVALDEEPADPAEFDRWLSAHDRKVAAKALREAADDESLRLRWHSGISIRGLRDRAARIEQIGEDQ